jgi:hypothetical protein
MTNLIILQQFQNFYLSKMLPIFSPKFFSQATNNTFRVKIWNRCNDFENIFANVLAKQLAVFFVQTKAIFCKNLIITYIGF